MTDEKAVIRKPSSDAPGQSSAATNGYEVIVKFHRDARPVVEAFLRTNMVSVTIAQTENTEVLLAYCRFEGNLNTLDETLAFVRQSAMVVLGEREEKFLDFFVALQELPRPFPQLLPSTGITSPPRFLRPEWVKGLLLALGMFALWQGYQFASGVVSRAVNPPPASVSAPVPTYSLWSPYVLPEYHQAWLDLKKKHGLSDEMMLSLFATIKGVDHYGAGHPLRDLTIYPAAMDRALGLVILKDVGGVEDLRTLLKTLQGYSAGWRSFPDNPTPRAGYSLFDSNDDRIILTFYEYILEKPRREFAQRLIAELRRSHLSG